MSLDHRLVLDLETKRTFDEAGGRSAHAELGVTVVGVYDYATNTYRAYEESEMGQLQNLLINASLVVGFNHVGFDFPVLQPYLSIDLKQIPVFDIMLDCQLKLGHRIGLDTVAQATLGIGKTGHGLDAIKYYREGRMQELKDYCLNDVKVTKEVFEYGIEHGNISFFSKMGNQKKEIKVDWTKYKKPRASSTGPVMREAQYKLF